MSWEALALVAVISQGSVTHQRHLHLGYAPGRGDGGLLATRAPYPSNRVDDPRRPGGNGREWIDTAEHGGVPTRWAIGWGDPGPGAYGADELDASVVYARVGHLVVGCSAWERIDGHGMARLEDARNEWLEERGYVGGVRTFRNHAAEPAGEPRADAGSPARPSVGEIVPSAVIEIPADQPRFRHRQRVQRDRQVPRVVEPSAPVGALIARGG